MADEELIAAIAASLDARRASVCELEGERRGIQVSVRTFRTSSTGNWLVKSKGASPEVLFTVRARNRGERHAVESGAITEVLTGDVEFDRDWLVEGAPAATTRAAVDPALREAVVAARRGVALVVDQGDVSAGANQFNFDVNDVERTVELVVRARERLATMKREGANEEGATAEIAALRKRRERTFARAPWPTKVGLVFFGLVLVLGIGGGLIYGCLPN